MQPKSSEIINTDKYNSLKTVNVLRKIFNRSR